MLASMTEEGAPAVCPTTGKSGRVRRRGRRSDRQFFGIVIFTCCSRSSEDENDGARDKVEAGKRRRPQPAVQVVTLVTAIGQAAARKLLDMQRIVAIAPAKR